VTEGPSGGAYDALSEFVSTAQGVVATGQDLDESNTKAKIVTPLIRTLGWRVYDNQEVLLEYSGKEGFDDRVDYALFGPDDLYAVVEAKQIGSSLSDDDPQIRRYMRLFGADWGLLTNGQQYLIYEATDENDERQVESIQLADLPSSVHLQSFKRKSAYAASAAVDSTDQDRSRIPQDSIREIEQYVERQRENSLSYEESDGFGPLYESLIRSIAPSVYAQKAAKLAVLLSLAGGVRKPFPSGQPVRGAIHVLLVYDPGTLTADLAESAAQLAPDPIYLSAADAAEQLLTAEGDMEPLFLNDLNLSIETLSTASHAVIRGFNEIENDDFERLRAAFDAEPPDGGANPQLESRDKTGIVTMARPKYGRFDQYDPIGEQINLAPEVIANFDLIFTLIDTSGERDAAAADHRLEVTEATKTGSLTPNGRESGDSLTDELSPSMLQTYIAYVRENYDPSLDDEAREHIEDFYTEFRKHAAEEPSPIPLSLREIDAAQRLAEASARLRLSGIATVEDAKRVTDVIEASFEDLGLEPDTESGLFDAEVVETGTSKEQRNQIKSVKNIIAEIAAEHDRGAPVDVVFERAEIEGIDPTKAKHKINKLKQKGEVYEHPTDHLRTT